MHSKRWLQKSWLSGLIVESQSSKCHESLFSSSGPSCTEFLSSHYPRYKPDGLIIGSHVIILPRFEFLGQLLEKGGVLGFIGQVFHTAGISPVALSTFGTLP